MTTQRISGILLSIAVVAAPSAVRAQSYSFGFETGWEGWAADGTDLELGDGTIDWHIERSTALPASGAFSLEYHLDNRNDAGKIWIERAFPVRPFQAYRVGVSFKLASNISSRFGAFTIIAGVTSSDPEKREHLTYQGTTENGGSRDYVWLSRSYGFVARSDFRGRLYVAIGVWGTWEVPHTYYVDDVRVVITPIIGPAAVE